MIRWSTEERPALPRELGAAVVDSDRVNAGKTIAGGAGEALLWASAA